MQKLEIKNILNQKYERSNWKTLIKIVFKGSNFLSSPRNIATNNSKIKGFTELGYINLSDGKKLSLFEIEVKKEINLGRNKVELRNFTTQFIDQNTNHGVLVIFNNKSQNYRFTFCSKYSEITEEGEIIERETSSKRYTYLLGENEVCSTPAERLSFLQEKKENISLLDVTEAFNVEKVSNEFFEKYKELYLKLYEDILALRKNKKNIDKNFKENDISTEEFAKKFLGQIVFIYFLQKKGWLGIKRNKNGVFGKWGSGPKDFLRRLFDQEYKKYNNFFNDIIEPFFYTALNTELPDSFFPYLNCKIPFLNGGLFEPIKNYNWAETDIIINNKIIKDILDVFDQYNFTINENDPLEREIAIDPEMLGKTFEKLLDVKDRRSSGTYYTPREIVKFMCEDSLTAYLVSKTDKKLSNNTIKNLIKFEDLSNLSKAQEIKQSATILDKSLRDIRLCDPAVGTGAFVVEMMNLITKTRKKLDYFINKNRNEYFLKVHAIQKSIYGVDIEHHAIEIAKLRLWLSLIIDETNYEKINALPNLDFKFMAGNSLYRDEQANLLHYPIFKEIENLKNEYLITSSHKKKKTLAKQISELYSSIDQNEKNFDYKKNFSEIFEKKENEGFDIIIGNPPYVRGDTGEKEIEIKKDNLIYKKIYNSVYNGGRTDLYVYFIKKADEICRKNGIISLIISNKWMSANYGKKIRIYLSSRKINKLIDFGDLPIFEAVVCPNILIATNENVDNNLQKTEVFDASVTIKNKMKILSESITVKSIKKYLMQLEDLFNENKKIFNNFPSDGSSWSVSSEIYSSRFISAKKRLVHKLKDKKIIIRRGIITGSNEAFVISRSTRQTWINIDKKCEDFLKPYLRGRNLIPWAHKEKSEYIIFADRNFKLSEAPSVIKNHLQKHSESLKARVTVPNSHLWYQLTQPQVGYINDFEDSKKIVWRDISNRSVASIVGKGFYLDNTCYYIPLQDMALCSWMHSDFFMEYLSTITSSIRGEALRWKKQWIEQVYYYPEEMKKDLEKIYELSIKNSDKGISELNKLVNKYLEK